MRFRFLVLATCALVIFTTLVFSIQLTGKGSPQDQTLRSGNLPSGATEALAAFDGLTNGFVAAQADHDLDAAAFNEHEGPKDGLGPLYNADSCGACHFNTVTGGISEVTELRVGHRDSSGSFVDAAGGSLINSAALPGVPLPYVPEQEKLRTFRTALSTLGDGYIEAIADSTIEDIARNQSNQSRGRISGQVIRVPLAEAPGAMRVARFGWKNQHASLTSFSADAYLNEMGITTPFLPTERTMLGINVTKWDQGPLPNDDGEDVAIFARFMRATKAPPRDVAAAATAEAQAGSALFDRLDCAVCHVRTIVTAPPGTAINAGTLTVPAALGNKVIHPFSDFLLHDVGTGDGIVQNGGPDTANKFRTPPLWGVRTRNRLMHDGESLTFEEAIRHHNGEAQDSSDQFQRLAPKDKKALVAFLRSL